MPQQPNLLLQFGPQQTEGPFSEVLTTPGVQPGPQNTGWASTLGNVADIAGKFLSGASQGRLMQFQKQENERNKAVGILSQYINRQQDDPNLTEDAKKEIYNLGLTAAAHSVLGSDGGKAGKGGKGKDGKEGGGIGHIFKEIALGMVGGKMPQRGEILDPVQIMKGIEEKYLSDPQYDKRKVGKALDEGVLSVYQKILKESEAKGEAPTAATLVGSPELQAAINAYRHKGLEEPPWIARLINGQMSMQDALQQAGLKYLQGGQTPQGSPSNPSSAGQTPSGSPSSAPAAAPPASASAPPEVRPESRPLFGAPVQVPIAAQAFLHKQGFNPGSMYMVDKSGKSVATVEEYQPGKWRQIGTNQALDQEAMRTMGYRLQPDKPTEHAESWKKVDTVIGRDGKPHAQWRNFATGQTYEAPEEHFVNRNAADQVQIRLNRTEDRFRDDMNRLYDRKRDRIERIRMAAPGTISNPEKLIEDVQKDFADQQKYMEAMHDNRLRQIMGQPGKGMDPKVSGTVAERNHNPLNLKMGDEFRNFGDDTSGFQAGLADVRAKLEGRSQHGLTGQSTLREFFQVWAPKEDGNDPDSYAARIADWMRISPDTKIGTLKNRSEELARYIARQEGYGDWAKLGGKPAEAPPESRKPTIRESGKGRIAVGAGALLE